MENEIWKPVVGYEGLYEVSNLGNVRNARTLHVLAPQKRQHGYLGVPLYGKGGHKTRGFKTFAIHRLVAEAFLDNPNNYPEVNHIDEDKTNNRADNLEWTTRIGNVRHGTCIERSAKNRINNPLISTRVAQYTLDGDLVHIFESYGELRRQGYYNIYYATHNQRGYTTPYGYRWVEIDKS